ncbi:MAG: type I-B CRISPR-associated protein Cas8b1/Cst1 [Enterococcaceae bacterium]|jgi:CRISPR-associated protein Cst1|nr:type I-B CRISPR-associated protein Cas8b1/Cst1 [Enterococcaceae bacterium]
MTRSEQSSVSVPDVIEFRLNSWMENAAICGLVNIIGKENVEINQQSIIVPLTELKNFEEKYFRYFAEQYEALSSITKILEYEEKKDKFEQTDFKDFDEKALKELQEYLTLVKRYGESNSYKAVYPLIDSATDISDLISGLKQFKFGKTALQNQQDETLEQVKKCYQNLDQIYEYYKRPDVQRYLPAKIQIYSVINKGYSDVSFLNRQESKGDFFIKYHEYFVEPVLEYLKNTHEKDKLNCMNCGRLIKNADIPYSFINQAGFDKNRKTSNAWNFTNDLYMCPICRLLYTCIPAGFTYVYNQGLFVNDNHSVQVLLQINQGIRLNILKLNKDNVKTTNTYAALIRTLQEEMVRQNKRALNDVQVVRFENDRYYFNLLPKIVLQTISDSQSELSSLLSAGYYLNGDYHSLYQESITHLLNNTNLFMLIYQALRLKLTGERVFANDAQILNLIKINQKFLEELIKVHKMEKEELQKIRTAGYWFRKEYSNENKPKSIGLKLLNALRANDKDSFMDVLLNSYMYINKQVPKVFLDIFLDDELFKTIGYSFVSGIIGKEYQENKGGNADE